MKRLKISVGLIIGILVLIVVFQNVEQVSTKLLFITIRMPRAVLLIVAVLLGFILGQIFTFDLKKR